MAKLTIDSKILRFFESRGLSLTRNAADALIVSDGKTTIAIDYDLDLHLEESKWYEIRDCYPSEDGQELRLELGEKSVVIDRDEILRLANDKDLNFIMCYGLVSMCVLVENDCVVDLKHIDDF